MDAYRAGSHRGLGWEAVTERAIDALIERHRDQHQPLVGLLWGAQARTLAPALTAADVPVVTSAHPSPLSAHRGFFGSRPFSQVNAHLQAQGAAPIDWQIR